MRRPSLNHAYRLVWSAVSQAFVPVPERTAARGKGSRRGRLVTLAAGAVLLPVAALADLQPDPPTNGATVAMSGSTTDADGFSDGGASSLTINIGGADAVFGTISLATTGNTLNQGGSIATYFGTGGDGIAVSGSGNTINLLDGSYNQADGSVVVFSNATGTNTLNIGANAYITGDAATQIGGGAGVEHVTIAGSAWIYGDINLGLGTDSVAITGAGNGYANIIDANAVTITTADGEEYALWGAISGTGNTLTKAGAGTVVLGGNNTFTGGTTISGGTLQVGDGANSGALTGNVANAGTLRFYQPGDATFEGNITGTGGVTKDGSDTVTLSGSNSFSGATQVNGGTLIASGGTAIGNASAVTVAEGATLQLGANETIGSLAGGGAVDLDSFTLSAGGNGASTTFSGVASGTGGLTKQGNGTLTLTGENAYEGSTTISAGTLQIGDGGTTGSVAGNIVNSRTLVFNRGDDVTFSGVISGAGSVTKQGDGTLVLASTNTYSGGTTVSAGTLQVGDGGTAGAISGNVTNNAALVFDRTDAVTFSGNVSGTGTVAKNGAGTLVLGGNSGYSGATFVNAGTLETSGGSAIGNNSAVTVAEGATLVLGANETIGSLAGDGAVSLDNTLTTGGNGTSTTFGGVASGSGGLTKQGAGTLTLTGDNTATGTFTVSAGTLQVGNGGSSGSIAGNIVNSAVLVFDRADDLAYAGNISGTGSVTQQGDGTLTLTGTNTWTGGTTVASGVLRIGAGGTSGSLAGNVANEATLTFDRSDALSYTGVVSGSGALVKQGAGTLTLTATQTYTGGTTISGGTLQLGNGGTGGTVAGDIENDGTLAFNRSNALTFGGVISGTGSVQKSGAGALTLSGANTYTGGTVVTAGSLRGDATSLQGDIVNNAVVVFDQAADGTYDGALSGSGTLTKSGAGTLTLTGDNLLSGTTTITAGRLVVNGLLDSTVTVGNGAAFGGTGTLAGLVASAGSRIAPGNSIGTTTVDGDVTFGASSTFEVEANAAGAADRIEASGAATINGGTVEVLADAGGSWDYRTRYAILTADGGVTGEFDDVTSDLAFLTPSLSYDADSVTLLLQRNDLSFAGAGETPNEIAAAVALTSVAAANPGSEMEDLIVAFTGLNASQAREALATLSGESAANLSQLASASARHMLERHVRHRTMASGQSSGDEAAGTRVWVEYGSASLKAENEVGAGGYNGEQSGGVFGIDWTLDSGTVLGVSAGNVSTDVAFRQFNDRAELHGRYLALSARGGTAKSSWSGLLAGGQSDISTTREVIVAPMVLNAAGETDADEVHLYADYAYALKTAANGQSVTPYAGLQVSRIGVGRYTETGAGAANLTVGQQSLSSFATHLGAKVGIPVPRVSGSVDLTFGWVHEFADVRAPATMAFASDPLTTFTVNGVELDRDGIQAGIRLAGHPGGQLSWYAEANGEFRHDVSAMGVLAGLAWQW